MPVAELKAWPDNPRRNDGRPVNEVVRSIRRFGFGAPILARKSNGEVIAGHTRLKAALELRMPTVPVRYLDLGPDEAHLLALADNRVGELADWEEDRLANLLRTFDADGIDLDSLGWTDGELEALLQDDTPAITAGDDEVPGVGDQADSKPGTRYQLGPHSLFCGDACDADSWQVWLGKEFGCVWTDPPYGVGNVGGAKDARHASYQSGDTLANDDLDAKELRSLLVMVFSRVREHVKPGAAVYCASPSNPARLLVFCEALGDLVRHMLVWVKASLVFCRSDYHYRHEPILYGWVPGAAHYFTPDRTHDTVLEFDRGERSFDHPTMKPVGLVAHCIGNSTLPGQLVVDPFGGSGTTLIACAKLGRVAHLIEISPHYCDVIRRRWTKWATDNGHEVGSGGLND